MTSSRASESGHRSHQAGVDVAQRKAPEPCAGWGTWGLGLAVVLCLIHDVQGFNAGNVPGLRSALQMRTVVSLHPSAVSRLCCVEKGIGGRAHNQKEQIPLHQKARRAMATLMSYSKKSDSPEPVVEYHPQILPPSQVSPDGPFLPFKKQTPPAGVYQTLWLHNELVTAVSTEDLNKAKELLENGADPNVVGPSGWSAFHWAVQLGLKDVVIFLLDHGANCETRSLTGHTALHRAAILGDADMIRLLVSEGKADVRARQMGFSPATSTRDTALHFAASFGHQNCVTVLKEFGADVFAEDCKGVTARVRALSVGNFDMADQLALWEAEIKHSRLFSRIEGRVRNLLGSLEQADGFNEFSIDDENLAGSDMDGLNSSGSGNAKKASEDMFWEGIV